MVPILLFLVLVRLTELLSMELVIVELHMKTYTHNPEPSSPGDNQEPNPPEHRVKSTNPWLLLIIEFLGEPLTNVSMFVYNFTCGERIGRGYDLGTFLATS
jgi:hypothetical protein